MKKNMRQPRLAQVRSCFSKHLTALALKPVHLVKYHPSTVKSAAGGSSRVPRETPQSSELGNSYLKLSLTEKLLSAGKPF